VGGFRLSFGDGEGRAGIAIAGRIRPRSLEARSDCVREGGAIADPSSPRESSKIDSSHSVYKRSLQSFDLLKAMRDPGIHVEMLIRCVPSGFGSVAFTSRLGGGSNTRSENQSSVRHR